MEEAQSSELGVEPNVSRRGIAGLPLGGALLALGATTMWSTSAITIEALNTGYHLTALEISVWRVLLILPLVLAWIAIRRVDFSTLRLGDLPVFVAAGFIGITLAYVTWAGSVSLNGPPVAAALAFSAPALIALGDRLLFGSRLRSIQWTAIGLNLVGCALASGIHSLTALTNSPLGVLIGVANGATFAGYTLLNRAMRHTGQDPMIVLLLIFVTGEIGLLSLGLPAEGTRLFLLHLDLRGWLLLLAVGIGPTLLAYALYNLSLHTLPPTVASVITTLEPPIVAVASFVLLGQEIGGMQWLGILVLVGGVLTMQISAAALGRGRAGRR